MTEMVANAGRITAIAKVPLIADADTGYGNELNVTRTVREYESRGIAGIHLEDQVSPKRCGHLDGKQIIERSHFTSLVTAARASVSMKTEPSPRDVPLKKLRPT